MPFGGEVPSVRRALPVCTRQANTAFKLPTVSTRVSFFDLSIDTVAV
jgi:hypothetical protein